MSIFGTIMSKIFGAGSAQAAPSGDAASSAPAAPSASASQPSAGGSASAPASGGSAPPTAPSSVDVAEVLDGMEPGAGQKLDWRHSIVDLMKLLHLDSSLTARKELAHELNYTGSTEDSATMNIWLHKQVMQKLAENGGKLPPDLH